MYKNFAKTLKRLRKEQKITQVELAGRIKVGRTAITNYETGYSFPEANILKKIAKVLNVDIDYLLECKQKGDYVDEELSAINDTSINIENMFANRIKTLRKENNLTQEQFADLFNISVNSVRRYEAEKQTPNISLLKSLATHFDISVDYLLGVTDTQDINTTQNDLICLEQQKVTNKLKHFSKVKNQVVLDFIDYVEQMPDEQEPIKKNNINTFPERLKYLREQKGLSQKTLADKLNVSTATCNYYENGKIMPTTNKIKALAELFDVSADYLLGTSDIKQNLIKINFNNVTKVIKEEQKSTQNLVVPADRNNFIDLNTLSKEKQSAIRIILDL